MAGPAMSMCAQVTPVSMYSCKKAAAVQEPPFPEDLRIFRQDGVLMRTTNVHGAYQSTALKTAGVTLLPRRAEVRLVRGPA